jgi:hypothetical protein
MIPLAVWVSRNHARCGGHCGAESYEPVSAFEHVGGPGSWLFDERKLQTNLTKIRGKNHGKITHGIPSELLMVDAANYVNHLLQTLLQYRICSFLGSIIMLGICGLGLGMFWNKLRSPVLDPGSSLSWDFRCRWIPVDCFKHSLHSLLALGQSQWLIMNPKLRDTLW